MFLKHTSQTGKKQAFFNAEELYIILRVVNSQILYLNFQ